MENKLKEGKCYTFEAKHNLGTIPSSNLLLELKQGSKRPQPKGGQVWLRVDR